MPVGGSITQGVGSSNGSGYREELMRLLTKNNYTVEMVGSRNTGTMENNSHEGWRGFRVDEINTKARKSVGNLLPNLFTVNAGSNDCLQDFRMNYFGDRVSDLLENLWMASPGSTVVLSTLVVNRDPEIDARIISANQSLQKLVEKRVTEQRRIILADMYRPEGPSVEDLGHDGIHPDDLGYKKMAAIWYRAIEEAANKGFLQ